MVKVISDIKEYDDIIKDNSKLIVIDAYATWCGPCKTYAPEFERLSNEYSNVNFYKIDVDNSPDIANNLGVQSLPTFYFIKGGKVITTIVGAQKTKINDTIKQLMV